MLHVPTRYQIQEVHVLDLARSSTSSQIYSQLVDVLVQDLASSQLDLASTTAVEGTLSRLGPKAVVDLHVAALPSTCIGSYDVRISRILASYQQLATSCIRPYYTVEARSTACSYSCSIGHRRAALHRTNAWCVVMLHVVLRCRRPRRSRFSATLALTRMLHVATSYLSSRSYMQLDCIKQIQDPSLDLVQ